MFQSVGYQRLKLKFSKRSLPPFLGLHYNQTCIIFSWCNSTYSECDQADPNAGKQLSLFLVTMLSDANLTDGARQVAKLYIRCFFWQNCLGICFFFCHVNGLWIFMFSFDVLCKSKLILSKGKLLSECFRVYHGWIQWCGYLHFVFRCAKTTKRDDMESCVNTAVKQDVEVKVRREFFM